MRDPLNTSHAPDFAQGPVAHCAVVVDSDSSFLDEVLPFVERARAVNGRIAVNLCRDRLELLQAALGSAAADVTWSDTHEWEPHPIRRLRALDRLLASEDNRLFFVGECAFPRRLSPITFEWLRFDALLNESIANSSAEMLCIYDVNSLPPPMLERALQSHPLLGAKQRRPNITYRDARELFASSAGALEVPARAKRHTGQLSPQEGRAFVAANLRADGQGVEHEFNLIVSELVANARLAGAANVSIALWNEHDLVCLQVDDDGAGLDDPFVGYRLPPFGHQHGRGLYIVRHLAEATEMRSSDKGTSVRVYVASNAPLRAVDND